MEDKNRNLEAENEVFKGLFRSPFAFIIGGPVGFIANAIFTAGKAKGEIKRENAHKEELRKMGVIGNPDIFEGGRKAFEAERKEQKKTQENKLEYLKREFDGSEDPSFKEYFRIRFNKKPSELLHKEMHYTASITCGSNYIEDTYGGSYYPDEEFLDKYNHDKANGNIIKKYRFYNNKANITFGYTIKCKDGIKRMVFTGLFTQI